MGDNFKKYGTLAMIVGYIILALLITFALPNILSLGKGNVEMVLSSGQTAAIINKDIDISQADKKVDIGDKIYVSTGVGDRPIVSHKKVDGAVRGLVKDVNGNMARVELYYTEGESKFTPGLAAFQGLIFIMLLKMII